MPPLPRREHLAWLSLGELGRRRRSRRRSSRSHFRQYTKPNKLLKQYIALSSVSVSVSLPLSLPPSRSLCVWQLAQPESCQQGDTHQSDLVSQCCQIISLTCSVFTYVCVGVCVSVCAYLCQSHKSLGLLFMRCAQWIRKANGELELTVVWQEKKGMEEKKAGNGKGEAKNERKKGNKGKKGKTGKNR